MSWKFVNTAMIVASFLIGPFVVTALDFGSQTPTIEFVIAMPLIVGLSVTALCFLSNLLGEKSTIWKRPALDASWLSSDQPVQLFMLHAHCFSAMSLGALAYEVFSDNGEWTWVFLLCIAVGIYAGVFLAGVLFKQRFEQPR